MRNRILARAAILHALVVLATCLHAAPAARQLAPGVVFTQDICGPPGAEIINSVTIDPASPGVKIKAAIGQDVILSDDWRKGREIVSSMTARKGALLGVNADFFPFTGDPLGMCIVDGELISEPAMNRVVLAVLGNGGVFFDNPRMTAKLTLASGVSRPIDGINRGRETNQVVAYTEIYGPSTGSKYKATDIILTSSDIPIRVGKPISATVTEVRLDAIDTPIPKGGIVLSGGGPAAFFLKESLKAADTVTLQFDVKSDACYDWPKVEQAVGGGPWLLKNGEQFIDCVEEGFNAPLSSTAHPRTAAGVTSDGKLILATVDGRQPISCGMTLPDLAALMKRLGALNAINLDGGGSTTFSIRGMVVNSPSEGIERPVANALLVLADQPKPEELPRLAITGIEGEVRSGEPVQLFATWGEESQMLTQDQLDRIVWGTSGGVGFVNQQGVFTPVKARKGAIKVSYGAQLASVDVNVVAGAPASLSVQVTPDAQDPSRAAIKATVSDSNGNVASGQNVTLEVTGGTAEAPSGTTDEKGEFSATVVWDPAATAREIRAACGTALGAWTGK